jgi:hypothetical protein
LRYSGKLGLAEQIEDPPGVWDEKITEHDVVGDMVQRSEALEQGDNVLPRHVTTTSVSLLSRGVGPQDHSMFRYLTHAGKRWSISSIVDQPPRIVLYFGEEYRGPIPIPAP